MWGGQSYSQGLNSTGLKEQADMSHTAVRGAGACAVPSGCCTQECAHLQHAVSCPGQEPQLEQKVAYSSMAGADFLDGYCNAESYHDQILSQAQPDNPSWLMCYLLCYLVHAPDSPRAPVSVLALAQPSRTHLFL
jgi:hypothetical protein